MTIEAFRHLVLTLAQHYYVRAWRLWPPKGQEPRHQMALSVQPEDPREAARIEARLRRLRFRRGGTCGEEPVWVVERTEA